MSLIRPCLALGYLVLGTPVFLLSDDECDFLNFAIFNLPPESFAGIPLEERPELFQRISSQPEAKEIDYDKGFFFHRKETEPGEKATSLWLKLLPRASDPPVQNPYSPLVYLHIATPHREVDFTYTTRVLMWRQRNRDTGWVDVTDEILPDFVDLSMHLPPKRNFVGVDILPDGHEDSHRTAAQVLVWEDWKLHRRDAFPFSSSIAWEAPVDAERLSVLAFLYHPESGDDRELAELIAHAAVKKDERFRGLLAMETLRESPVISYAMAAYEYAIDGSEEAVDFIVRKVAEEGNGDTNSKWMLCYFDEWDRTLEAYHKYDGRDGAAAEASYMFVKQREYFFPENFEKYWKKKRAELGAGQ